MRFRIVAIATCFFVALSMGAGSARAKTWRVALDGSGDTNSIHDAGQMAASGDTISIAPGRYSVLIDHFDGYDTRKVIAAFEGDKQLTILGDDRETVVIGPASFAFHPPDSPISLYWLASMPLNITGVTVVNSFVALSSVYAEMSVTDCVFSGNRSGVTAFGGGVYSVTECYFEGRSDGDAAQSELSLWTPDADTCRVEHCEFVDSGKVSFQTTDWGEFRDSRIEGFYVQFYLSSGMVENCELSSFVSVDGTGNPGVRISDSVFHSGPDVEFGISVYSADSIVELSGNILEGGTAKNLFLYHGASVTGTGNHILRQPGTYAVELSDYPSDVTANVDLRGNYWGTAEADSVAAWIWDVHDAECSPSPQPGDVCTEVLYLPIESNPVPEEKTSLGGLKALFR